MLGLKLNHVSKRGALESGGGSKSVSKKKSMVLQDEKCFLIYAKELIQLADEKDKCKPVKLILVIDSGRKWLASS